MKKKLLSLMLILSMVLSLVHVSPTALAADKGTETSHEHVHAEANAVATKADGATVLAFTSDTHNMSDNTAANRLGSWLDKIAGKYGGIDVMAFGGDMADANASQSNFWTYTQADMTQLTSRSITGVYTTGNHEHSPGSYSASSTNETQKKFVINAEAAVGDDYRIYCLGSNSWNSSYADQVSSLTSYLNSVGNDKVIFIITHFPLHYYSGRTTSSASSVIDALNNAVVNNGQTIVFLWGHNHTMADTYYDQIYGPGGVDSIQYGSSSSETKTIKFYYGAAGCMSDSEYSKTGSAKVLGKGLIVTITPNRGNATMAFDYYNADGTKVTESNSVLSADITVRATSSYTLTDSLVAGGEYLIANGNTGEVYVVSNEVSGSGNSAGLVGIAASVEDGKITLSEEDAAKAAFTAELKTSDSGSVSAWLNNGGSYLYTASSNGLRISSEQTSSGNTGKFWHYNATDKLLWFFKDTSSTDGYSDNSGTYKYWLDFSDDGTVITAAHTSNSGTTSISDFTTDDIYLFVKGGSGTTPEDPPAGETVSVTPSTSNPESSVTIAVGETLTINVTNSSTRSAYDFTATFSATGVAEIQGSNPVNVAAGATSQLTVKGVTDGTVDITISNNNSSSERKATIHLTVGDGGSTQTGQTVSVTPSTSNPEESATINVGETLAINVTNGSSSSAYDFTASLSNSGIAQIQNTTVNIAAGATGQFTVTGLTDGTVDITIQNSSSYGSQYVRKATIHLTVVGSSTPVAVTGVAVTPESVNVKVGKTTTLTATVAPTNATNKNVTWTSSDNTIATVSGGVVTGVAAGTATITVTTEDGGFTDTCAVTVEESNDVKYELATTLEDGGEYLIVNTNTAGSAYALKNPGTSGTNIANASYKTSVTIESGNYILTSEEDIVWTAVASGSGFHLSNGGLYLEGSGGNTGVYSTLNNADRAWTYSSSNQLQMPGSTNYTYTIRYNSNYFQGSSSTSSNTYTVYLFRKAGTDPVSGVTLEPTTLNLAVGETGTLTATVLPSTAANKAVTWSSDNETVATVANGVVTAVGAGTATITVTTVDGGKTDTCTVTVTAAETYTYYLTETLEDGGEYLIVNGKTGAVYVVGNTSTGSGNSTGLVGISANVVDDSITLTKANAEKATFTAELKTSTSGAVSAWLKLGDGYLYSASSGGLRISSEQTSSGNTGKYWHYKADGKDLLWYFKDTSSSDGYTDTSNTYKYYLKCSSSGTFTSANVSSTSLADTDTPAIYLFKKATEKIDVTGVALDPTTATVEAGKTVELTATVAPENATNKGVTWTSSDESIATVSGGVVTGVAAGTATITVTTKDGGFTATCVVTVTAPQVDRYVKVNSIKAGGEYIITNNADVGADTTRALKNPGGSTSGVTISSSNGKTTVTILEGNIIETADMDIVWKATTNEGGFYLTNGDDYLEVYQQSLRVFSGEPKQAARYWTYNLSTDANPLQLRHNGGNSTYSLYYTNGSFSASSSTTNSVYIFEKVSDTPHEHSYGEPVWSWTADHTSATATFTCDCGDSQTVTDNAPVEALVTAAGCETNKVVKYTATVTFKGTEYTDTTENITVPNTATGHAWTVTGWTWSEDYTSATAALTCSNDSSHSSTQVVTATSSQGTGEDLGYTIYRVSLTIDGKEYSDTKRVVNQYTLTFKDGDATIAVLTQDYGTEVTAPTVSDKDFYTFGGWDQTVPATMPAENKTFNAVWNAIEAYYLIGSMTDWELDPTYRFEENTAAEGEYIFNTTLTLNDELKVVKGVGETKQTWYPAGDNNNYVVDTDHSGSVTVYFRPDGNNDSFWQNFGGGGFFIIVKAHQATVQVEGVGGSATLSLGNQTEVTTVTASRESTITVNATPNAEYALDKIELWKANGGTAAEQTLTGTSFSMPDYDVIVKVYFKFVAHEWDYENIVWAWDGNETDGFTATATFNCKNGDGGTQTITATVTGPVVVEPTPTVSGSKTYTATVTGPDGNTYTNDKVITLPPAGYTFKDPVYSWNGSDENGWSVTALKECNEDPAQNITETVSAVYSVVTPATCTAAGAGLWTATFTNSAFETQTKDVTIPAKNHDWAFVNFTWTGNDTDGYTAAVANFKCNNDASHTETKTATVTPATTAATCEAAGQTVYTASIAAADSLDGKAHEESKTVTIAALGHDWNEPTFTWNADHTSVTAHFVCSRNAEHTHDEVVTEGIQSQTTEPTATEPGKIVYTVTFTFDGKEYTAIGEVEISATGVTLSGNITSYVGRTEEGAVTVQLFAEGSEEAAYTATVSEDNATYTFAGVASGTYTMKVSKKDHVTRSYDVTVANEAVTQDVKIHLLGDIDGNGKVTNVDFARANSHVQKRQLLTGYEFDCADIDGNGKVTNVDAARINSHVQKRQYLW